MSANFLKFRCTWTGRGKFACGQRLLDYGDEIILPADQASRYIKHTDISKGYMEFLGGAESADAAFSANIQGYLEGKMGVLKQDALPTSILPLKTAGITTIQGADASAFLATDREMALSRLMVRMPTVTDGVDAPRFLVSSGGMQKVTPSTLRYYDDSGTAYGAMTNGSIDAAAPIVWAASDLMIIGYTEKFRSVNVSVDTAAATAGAISAVSYWNGSAWVAFDDFVDYTQEPSAANSFDRAGFATDTNIRVVWWEAPQDWKPGGPAGSGVPADSYVVALTISGALTTLDGARFYPVLDTPIADVNFGLLQSSREADAVVTVVGTTYADFTAQVATIDLSNADFVYLGFSQPVGGIYVDVTNTDATVETLSFAYWAGQSSASGWSGEATVAADAWAGGATGLVDGTDALAQDGAITWSVQPSDWVAAPYTELPSALASGIAALGTVTDSDLYWIKMSASGAMDADNTDRFYGIIPTVAWFNMDPKNSHVGAGEDLHVHVIDEHASASTQIMAVLADI